MTAEIEPGTQVDRRAEHVERPVPPTTTTQQDKTTAGQRRINLIWEVTQAIIAVTITLACVIVAVWQALHPLPASQEPRFPVILAAGFGTIIGFYFARTNHAAIGGTGWKPNEDQEYRGR